MSELIPVSIIDTSHLITYVWADFIFVKIFGPVTGENIKRYIIPRSIIYFLHIPQEVSRKFLISRQGEAIALKHRLALSVPTHILRIAAHQFLQVFKYHAIRREFRVEVKTGKTYTHALCML